MASAKDHSRTKAAAMAHATRGRKTSFRTASENRQRAQDEAHNQEIQEGRTMKRIGSQTRETIEESGYSVIGWIDKESAVLQANGDPTQKEIWVLHDDHAGYTIEINGLGYEFVCDYKGEQMQAAKAQCLLCSGKLNNDDAELCNECWELKSRIERNPTLAQRILNELSGL